MKRIIGKIFWDEENGEGSIKLEKEIDTFRFMDLREDILNELDNISYYRWSKLEINKIKSVKGGKNEETNTRDSY